MSSIMHNSEQSDAIEKALRDRIEQLERELEHANGTIDDLRAQVKRQAEMLRSHSESIHPNFDAWWDSDKSSATPNTYKGWEESCRQAWYAAIDALKAQSEPVAWMREWEGDVSDLGNMIFAADESEKDDNPNWAPLYTTPQPSAEDVKDAARYQWLKANANNGFDPSEDVQLIVSGDIGADAAIDAARGEGK